MSDEIAVVVPAPETIFVVVTQDVATVVESINQGPSGASGASTFTVTAGQDLSGHRIVSVNSAGQAVYADKDTPATVRQVLGLTTGAALNGTQATVLPMGEITEPSWTLSMSGPVYLGNNGLLTQILPTTGVIMQVGVPLSSTMMLVDIKMPISLGG